MSFTYQGWEVEMGFKVYGNGQRAIVLYDVEDRSVISVCTVAIEESIGEDEVAIKDYSENEGTLDILMEEGIVSEPLRYVDSGFVKIPICKLLVS